MRRKYQKIFSYLDLFPVRLHVAVGQFNSVNADVRIVTVKTSPAFTTIFGDAGINVGSGGILGGLQTQLSKTCYDLTDKSKLKP
jgi:hypothetical protein